MLCPKCKIDRAHRAHRAGLAEHLISLIGFFPYKCRDCSSRFLRFAHASFAAAESLDPATEREIASTRSHLGRQRKHREILLYGTALLLFSAILYFLIREPSGAIALLFPPG